MSSLDEVDSQEHWFDGVFAAPHVQSFIELLIRRASEPRPLPPSVFTLTVALPDESGSRQGYRIVALDRPGRLGRLEVRLDGARSVVRTTNVRAIEAPAQGDIEIDGQAVPMTSGGRLVRSEDGVWSVSAVPTRRMGPAIQIADGRAAIVLLCDRAELDAAQCLAHGLHIYGLPRAHIVFADDALDHVRLLNSSNLIVIGPIELSRALGVSKTLWPPRASAEPVIELMPAVRVERDRFSVHRRVFDQPGYGASLSLGPPDRSGLLAMIPHPLNSALQAMQLAGTDAAGLERALRAFPLRTGTPVPELAVLGPDRRTGEVVAAGWWANGWSWSDATSYL